MAAHVRSTPRGHRPTILLYCPYDRKTTHHTRREDGSIVCAECGRRVEIADPPAAGPSTPRRSQLPSTTGAAPAIHRGPHVAPLRAESRRPFTPWLLVIVGGAVAALAALNVAINLGSGFQAPGAAAVPAPSGANLAADRALLVANTDGIGAFVRRSPQLEDKLRAWPDGTRLDPIGVPLMADGIEWRKVRDPSGTEGWIPTQYTRAADQP